MQQQLVFGALALIVAINSVAAVITVQIGGSSRLTSLSRSRDRYNCYWDCDLVGCQIARDDDECAYDCEKICRVRYDYAGRSGAAGSEMKPKAGASASPLADSLTGKSGSAAAVGPQVQASGSEPTAINDIGDLASELAGGKLKVLLTTALKII